MTDDIEKVARALAQSHGLDFDEVCGVDADPDKGECDSGACIASGYEDHDATYARAMYRADARTAIAAMTVQSEPVAWKNYADDGDWWLTDDREPADSCERSVPLYAHPPVPQWQGIESAPDLERVIVAGWNPHSGNVRGYWWYGEDVVSNGRAIEHPRATLWRPFNNPAFPTPPNGGSDAE